MQSYLSLERVAFFLLGHDVGPGLKMNEKNRKRVDEFVNFDLRSQSRINANVLLHP